MLPNGWRLLHVVYIIMVDASVDTPTIYCHVSRKSANEPRTQCSALHRTPIDLGESPWTFIGHDCDVLLRIISRGRELSAWDLVIFCAWKEDKVIVFLLYIAENTSLIIASLTIPTWLACGILCVLLVFILLCFLLRHHWLNEGTATMPPDFQVLPSYVRGYHTLLGLRVAADPGGFTLPLLQYGVDL